MISRMDEKFYRNTWVEVDLDVISMNLKSFQQYLPQQTKIMAMVKADGYGHGAVPVAMEALSAGACYLGVATLDEALALRKGGIEAPILVIGYTDPMFVEAAVLNQITLTVFDLDVIASLKQATQNHQMHTKVHLKVDSGMGRIGVRTADEFLALVSAIKEASLIEIEGAFTHFSRADEEDLSYSTMQHHIFMNIIQSSMQTIPLIHCCNTAAGIMFPKWGYNMIRLGIGLYGQYSSPDTQNKGIELTPAFALKSKVSYVKDVSRGTSISYGSGYTTERQERIASIPIGYADGYARSLSNRGKVLVKGELVPVVGSICMDQCMLNVTHLPTCSVGDEVVLIGKQGTKSITVESIAELLQTVNYEVMCMINKRVPRLYIKNGIRIGIKNYLL